jgi:glycosyltransferase involved in cell wall biosynthesis
MRVHVISLPHTLLTRDYDWCAYTAKTRRLVSMLHTAGIEALVYGPDIHTDLGPCADYVSIVTEADRLEWFGQPQWIHGSMFDRWSPEDPVWTIPNHRAATAIRERWEPGDILGLIAGTCQQQIATELADLGPLVCEWGIGYSGILENSHHVFESYAWLHHVAGMYGRDNIQFFDTVIPNCYDEDELDIGLTPGDYLLYMGRPIERKGLPVVAEIAKRLDIRVLIAGQPGPPVPGTEYVGLVTGQKKRDLLAGARALLAPTTYLEPFGGVTVEAMMSGTPVITTDHGAFTETVKNGLTGYRCRMLWEFLVAADRAQYLDRAAIAAHARARFSTAAGSLMYSDYFTNLSTLYGDGWYSNAEVIARAINEPDVVDPVLAASIDGPRTPTQEAARPALTLLSAD